MNRDLLVKTLKLHVETAQSLRELSRHNINFQIWRDKTRETLERAFGPQSELVRKFCSIKYHLPPTVLEEESHDLAEIRQAYLTGLDKAVAVLKESINALSESADAQEKAGCLLDCDSENHLSFQEIVSYIDQTIFSQDEQKGIKAELQEIYDSLNKKKLDKEKVRLHKSRLVSIFNSMAGKTGAILFLCQFSQVLEIVNIL